MHQRGVMQSDLEMVNRELVDCRRAIYDIQTQLTRLKRELLRCLIPILLFQIGILIGFQVVCR